MRMPIVEYVADLGLDRVTPRQKAMLAVIASYYNARYRSANLDMSALSHELLVSSGRWLRRQIDKVDKTILEHTAGRGPGAFYQFRFPEFEARTDEEKRVNGGSKEGHQRAISGPPEGHERATTDTVIRKDLNPDLLQNLTPLAQQLLELVGLPTVDLLEPVEAALECEAKKGRTSAEAYQFLLERTQQAQRRGIGIDRWFYTEGKYLQDRRAVPFAKQSNLQRAEEVNAEAQRILDEIKHGRKKLPQASGE